jgi:hypothetical protein
MGRARQASEGTPCNRPPPTGARLADHRFGSPRASEGMASMSRAVLVPNSGSKTRSHARPAAPTQDRTRSVPMIDCDLYTSAKRAPDFGARTMARSSPSPTSANDGVTSRLLSTVAPGAHPGGWSGDHAPPHPYAWVPPSSTRCRPPLICARRPPPWGVPSRDTRWIPRATAELVSRCGLDDDR